MNNTFNGNGIFPKGDKNEAYAKYFTGTSYLNMLSLKGLVIGNVTFEPGCRNFWHIHHKGGQILLITGGRGWYQEAGKPAQELRPGDVVNIAPRPNTGTARPRTAGLPMWPWKCLPRAAPTNGWNRSPTKNTTPWAKSGQSAQSFLVAELILTRKQQP